MIDILALNVNDTEAIAELVDALHATCDVDQCSQFLTDLRRWEHSIPKEARPVIDAYSRMVRRGAFVPAIVARYVTVVQPLEASPEWREILEWRSFILSLTQDRRAA